MKSSSLSRTTAALLGAGGVLAAYALCVGSYHAAYRGRVFPGVTLETGAAIGGQDRDAVLAETAQARDALGRQLRPLTLSHPAPRAEQAPFPIASFVHIDGDRLWAAAASEGRDWGTAWSYAPFLLRLTRPRIPVTQAIAIDRTAVRNALQTLDDQKGWSSPARAARFAYADGDQTVTPSADGETLDLQASTDAIVEGILNGTAQPVPLTVSRVPAPAPRTEDLAPLLPQASRWTSGPVRLTADGQPDLSIPPATIASFLTAVPTSTGPYALDLDRDRVAAYFAEQPLTHLQEPADGFLAVDASGTVTEIRLPTRGQALDATKTLEQLKAALERPDRQGRLAIETTYGNFTGEAAQRLGIKELLGVGASDFSGSPSNRRKNIALGARHVNNSLVAPQAEFSLLKALGPIDGEHGWLPELVIKGNKTTPEFGGGLCQIGTTVFRAALNVGLPITERRNHSYRVRYYEPAGTDATIYDPAPDFRFKNDTANWVLVTQDLAKDSVRFLVWGTRDGRVASSSKPVVTNIVQPPPKKIVETTELPPGETKCTEVAHAGATASFDYEVTYADGETKKQTFHSVYKPWQAVCLVGVRSVSVPGGTGVDETGLNNPG